MIDEHGFTRHGLHLTLILLAAVFGPAVPALAQAPSPADNDPRQAEIERLRHVIRDKEIQQQDPEQVVRAMRRPGELKAVEAIDDLIALLAFKYPKESRIGGTGIAGGAYDGYMAKSALFGIGEPALPALVQAIKDNDIGSIEFKNARQAVMSIFRGRLPEGSKYLREQGSQASASAAAQARLWAAAQALDDLHAIGSAEEER